MGVWLSLKVCELVFFSSPLGLRRAERVFDVYHRYQREPYCRGIDRTTDGVVTDLRQSINGREVPLSQTEEKVLSKNGNTTVTERIVRHYGANGQIVQTDRVVTEETKA